MRHDPLWTAKALWLHQVLDVDLAELLPGQISMDEGCTDLRHADNPYEGAGPGFGTLSGQRIEVAEDEILQVTAHLQLFSEAQGPDTANEIMMRRLRTAASRGAPLVGADAAFCAHELKESDLMKAHLLRLGLAYNAQNVVDHYYDVHAAALAFYGVSPWALYHPDAVAAADAAAGLKTMNPKYYEFWGIP